MSFGGSPSAPKPPPFKKIDPANAASLARQYDTLGYNLSDADFLSRFPGLVQLRDETSQDISSQVTGPLDPTLQNAFTSAGETGALSAFGGSTGSIGEVGSAARNATAVSVANQTQSKQDADRLALEQNLQENPERAFGLSGTDLINIMIGNVTGQNQRNYQAYSGQVSGSNAAGAAGAQETQAGIGLGISILSTIALIA